MELAAVLLEVAAAEPSLDWKEEHLVAADENLEQNYFREPEASGEDQAALVQNLLELLEVADAPTWVVAQEEAADLQRTVSKSVIFLQFKYLESS